LFFAVIICYFFARKFSRVHEWRKSSFCHCRFHLFGARIVRRRSPFIPASRSMHVLGNVANLTLYFSSPPSHMTNFPAAAACVAASLAAALCFHWLVRSEK
jgi:hypothetical protein